MLVSCLCNIDKRIKAIEKELSMMDLLGIKHNRAIELKLSNDLGPEFQWLDGATIESSLFRDMYYWCRINLYFSKRFVSLL